MLHVIQPRQLREEEKDLLDYSLPADFPGKEGLREQVGSAPVVSECGCAWGTVNLRTTDRAAAAFDTNVMEAYGEGLDVLPFVCDGEISSLEIVPHADERPFAFPKREDLKLWVPRKPKAHD